MPDREIQPSDLVSHFFDTSIGPERLDQLIKAWDAQIDSTCPDRLTPIAVFSGSEFAHRIAGVLAILEQVQEDERRQLDELLAHLHTAAMVVKHDGRVLAANAEAGAAFGTRPDGSIAELPFDAAELAAFADRLSEVAARPEDGEDLFRFRAEDPDRLVLVHLKALPGAGVWRSVLAVTSEIAWNDDVSDMLRRAFGLTGAEIEVLRHLVSGATVAAIARAGGRTQGTVRSQLHAILEKTGTRSQAEVVRLAVLLLESSRLDLEPRRAVPVAEPHQRFLRLSDGRRLELLCFGDPRGRPVIWMQSPYGYFRLPAPAEVSLADRGLRVVVPMRAGYCGSDPAPVQPYSLDLAVADMVAVMDQLDIVSAPVVAGADDIRIALMLAQAAPARVRHIFGIGASFPILDDRQYRRLNPIARFVRACARHGPSVLPFLIRGVRTVIRHRGIGSYLRGTFAGVPADARAFARPEVAAAIEAGIDYMFFREPWSEQVFCADMVEFHRSWPDHLGHVACPVTLIQGEQDGNSPFENVQEYCAKYPDWRCISYPDEGALVAHVRWREVLDLIDATTAPALADGTSGHAGENVLPGADSAVASIRR